MDHSIVFDGKIIIITKYPILVVGQVNGTPMKQNTSKILFTYCPGNMLLIYYVRGGKNRFQTICRVLFRQIYAYKNSRRM